MTDQVSASLKQEGSSCHIAITGLSHQTFNQTDNQFSDLNSVIARLCKDALAEDQHNVKSLIDEQIGIIVGQCCASSNVSANELFSTLALNTQVQGQTKKLAHPLEGIDLAFQQLRSSQSDVILLVLYDRLPKENLDNSYYLTAMILRPFSHALNDQRPVYATIPLLEILDKKDTYRHLRSVYQTNALTTQSINMLTLETSVFGDTFNKELASLSSWYGDLTNRNESELEDKPFFESEPWCSLKVVDSRDQNSSTTALISLVDTILSLQQKVFLPISNTNLSEMIDLRRTPFYFDIAHRPWFHPQIHRQFRNISSQPNYVQSLRKAAFHVIEDSGRMYHMVLEEYEDADEAKRISMQPEWPSELFLFFAESPPQLIENIRSIKKSLLNNKQATLKDLAYTVNSRTLKSVNQSLNELSRQSNSKNNQIKVAFICSTLEEYLDKTKTITQACLKEIFPEFEGDSQTQSIYWHSNSNNVECSVNKLAFILPGLGAAYPNMLAELCLHFPEIRAIFDFVDYLSVSAGTKQKPSDRIFCRMDPRTKSFRETPASLAVMDSAVVSVLMAEWAIFTLLLNLEIVPDILLGCSTGEFAALTMSSAVDIYKAAPLFYHLSTGMVHGLPLDQLINLRSLRVHTSLENIENQLKEHHNKVYLSANLSPCQLILTGHRESINWLVKSFESKNISADFLPFAIPYHTSLVSGVVSADNPDIAALQISKPLIESWSCSLAAPYPSKAEQIKKMTTDLFSKPIRFRESIESLYENGVRIFVEVGPRGSLAPVVSETLAGLPHTSLAANRSDTSAITQLQHVLAALFVKGVYMDLAYLFNRRDSVLLPLENEWQTQPLARQPLNIASLYKDTIEQIDEAYKLFSSQLQKLENDIMLHLSSSNSVPRKANTPRSTNNQNQFSTEISLEHILSELPDAQSIICCQILESNLPANSAALSALAFSMLTMAEMNTLNSFKRIEKQKQWLAGRIAAKEAVITLLSRKYEMSLNKIDIEIRCSIYGKPYIAIIDSNVQNLNIPAISISHKDGEVIAVAADGLLTNSIGVDIETPSIEGGLESFFLSGAEQELLSEISSANRSLYLKQIWSAKESVAKLLDMGLPECLTKLAVVNYEPEAGKYSIAFSKHKNNGEETASSLTSDQYIAHVGSLDKSILALAVY